MSKVPGLRASRLLGGNMRPLEISFEGIEKLSIIPDFDFYNLNLGEK